jgi:hypothetical protein
MGRCLNQLRIFIALGALLPVSAWAQQIAQVSPAFIDFGPIKMGATATVPVTLYNLGSTPLSIAGGGTGSDVGLFSLGGTCSGGSVPANGSCTLNYHFRPRSRSETVSASTSILLSGGGQSQYFPINLRGTGDESLAQVSPRFIDFGEELIGQTVSVPVTITNTHSATLYLAGGGIDAPFGAVSGSPSCAGGLAAGASCQFLYRFTPGQISEVNGSTTLGVHDGVNLWQDFSIQLRGRGRTIAGNVGLTPVRIDFGEIKLGNTVQIIERSTNRSGVPLQRFGGALVTSDNAFLSYGSNDPGCGGGSHPVGTTCTKPYWFTPRERRAHATSSNTYYEGTGVAETHSMHLTGTGIGRLARVSPVEVDFGAIRSGSQVSVQVTLTNTSPSALGNLLGGNVTGAFSRTTSCGASLASGSSCIFIYRFQPPGDGAYQTMTLLSYSNADGVQETSEIVLAGIGTSLLFGNGFE